MYVFVLRSVRVMTRVSVSAEGRKKVWHERQVQGGEVMPVSAHSHEAIWKTLREAQRLLRSP